MNLAGLRSGSTRQAWVIPPVVPMVCCQFFPIALAILAPIFPQFLCVALPPLAMVFVARTGIRHLWNLHWGETRTACHGLSGVYTLQLPTGVYFLGTARTLGHWHILCLHP
jgi:hypothetical protein